MSSIPTLSRPSALVLAAVLAAGSLLAGCGDDDGADVRQLGNDGGSASASGSASGPASGSASGSASGTATAPTSASGSATGVAQDDVECEPAGDELEPDAAATVALELDDYEFVPSDVSVGEAGTVVFTTSNVGEAVHEMAFLPGGGEVPFTADGQPDEEALEEMGSFELSPHGPGQACTATFELEAGEYTIFCLIPAADGETHYEKGMSGTVTVG